MACAAEYFTHDSIRHLNIITTAKLLYAFTGDRSHYGMHRVSARLPVANSLPDAADSEQWRRSQSACKPA